VFIPEKERVEIELSKKTKIPYTPIKMLNRTNKAFSKTLKNLYMRLCDNIYCQKKCNGKKWLNPYTKKRKNSLIKKGAISGCRNLMKEFPEYKEL